MDDLLSGISNQGTLSPMAVFAVIPLTDDAGATAKALERFNAVYRDYAPRAFFVRYGGTAKDLSERVGFTGKSGPRDGIVIPIDDCYGYGNADLWKWIDPS